MDEEILSSVNAEPVANVEPQQTEQVNDPVQTNNAEVVEPQQEQKPVQTQEDNARFAQVRREAEARARDKTIADMGMEWNGQPITTYEQYVKAKAESEEMARRQALQEQGIDPKIVDEYVNNNPTVKKAQELISQQEMSQRQQNEFVDFLDYFKSVNNRDYDSTKDQLPQEVWEMYNNGKSLADAYARHASKVRIAELEAKLKAQETNEKNAQSSPGSVTGNGEAKKPLTPEMIESMSTEELSKRWQEVKQVLKMR